MTLPSQFIPHGRFEAFVRTLMGAVPVIGPVAKKHKFVFARLEDPRDLRLDYDVTLLPPKKVLFPVRQDLVAFDAAGGRSCIAPKPQVLLGVHFYDVKALDQLDVLFQENHADNNWLAQREATTVVASSIQSVAPRAFWGTVGKEAKPRGHDAFLTRLPDGYVMEVRTAKGEALLAHGDFAPATATQIQQAQRINEDILDACAEKLKWSSDEIAHATRAAFGMNAIWEGLSNTCFSCGTCNIVCPTCYCFDVQDNWNLDQVSGVRTRAWDGCLTEDFAKVSLGAAACENFREERFQRYRHRLMRKTAYLNKKLGGPACVGCGRCSAGCVPDIADPVRIISRILEG
jgi:sulfhydrogenase subunit beta (sulfur reductase)